MTCGRMEEALVRWVWRSRIKEGNAAADPPIRLGKSVKEDVTNKMRIMTMVMMITNIQNG